MSNIKDEFKRIFDLLKYIFEVSPSYIFLPFLKDTVFLLITFSNLFYMRVVTNEVYISSSVNLKFIFLCGLFYLSQYFLYAVSYYINDCIIMKSKIRLKKAIDLYIYERVLKIDLLEFSISNFQNDLLRGVDSPEYRLYNAIDYWTFWLRALIYLIVFANVFISVNTLLVIPAFIMGLQSFFVTVFLNAKKIKSEYDSTECERRRSYLTKLLVEPEYAMELKHYNFYPFILKKNSGISHEQKKISKVLLKNILISNLIAIVISNLLMITVNIYVISNIYNDVFLIGDLAFIYGSITILGNMLGDLFSSFPNFKKENVYVGYMDKIMNYQPAESENSNGVHLTGGEISAIEFKDVSFAYPLYPEKYILKNFNLKITKGEKIAIVGSNGSGKSTFMNVLLYLYNVSGGQILINGNPYSNYNKDSLRACFSIVPQDFNIYAMSIKENIIFNNDFKNETANETVTKALEFVDMLDTVKGLNENINTNITKEFDKNGVYLSGGEMQKIAVARAIAQNKKLLVMDEPSSALDAMSEQKLFEKLLRLGKDITLIYISHHLKTVVNADRILVFSEGRIKEDGTHDELMKRKGLYYDMAQSQ